MLESFLKDKGLPTDNIIADQSQRAIVGNNLDDLIESIPADQRKDATMLDACRKLELISDTTYKKLKHILDMRNDTGISHPTDYSINAYELLGYLQNCIQDVLNDNPTEAAIQVQAFIKNLKTHTDPLDNTAQQGILKKFAELPSHLCGSLLRTVFGIYVSPDIDPTVRKNISLIAPTLWNACADEVKFKLGIVLEGYSVNLHKEKHVLGKQFFEVVGGQAFMSPTERAIIVSDLITELLSKHDGWDNFHHEWPVAAKLNSFVPNQASIIENLATSMFTAIMICRVGNGVQYNTGVSPGGMTHYNAMLEIAGDNYAPHVMAALTHYKMGARLGNTRCAQHARDALMLVKPIVINARINECLDFLIANIVSTPSCVKSTEFRKLSASYITWPD